jgi:hypothetical protein
MKKLRAKYAIAVMILFAVSSLWACKDEDQNEKSQYEVRITDAPGNFSEVNIHIVQVKVRTQSNGWTDLITNEGIYNLLDFSNGLDTSVAIGLVPSDDVTEVRFVLGDSNSVVVDNVKHDLEVPSGQSSGLKLKVAHQLYPNVPYSLLVDIDVAKSIVLTGNGKYILKPVLRAIPTVLTSGIKGDVDPDGVYTNIYAIKGTDTTGGVVNSLGQFVIKGLDAGVYDVYIDPASPYLPDTINNVQVTQNQINDLGTILLKQ